MIALYSRVSTAEQAKEGYSIGEQEERLTAFCKSHGWAEYKHFTDAGYSGGNLDRPAMNEMIHAIEEGTVERVIVYKLDRLSRSQKDTLQLLEDIFLPHDVDFISISENFDTSSPFGKATMKASIGLFSVFAQLERDTIRERVTIGRAARAKEGRFHGGSTPPIGYDYKEGKLVVNDFEAMQVKECFRLYGLGYTFTEIAKTLNEKGWHHKNGPWILKRVRRVLLNPVYIGKVSFSGVYYDGIHEPLIDQETFETVGAMIAKNHKSYTFKKRPINEAYLVGKMFCAQCGARYTHTISISGRKTVQKKISYYVCMNRNRGATMGRKCCNTRYRCDVIDPIIFDELRGLTIGDVKTYRQQQAPDNLKTLQKELNKIEKQRSRLIDLYSIGTFDSAELTAKVEPLNEAKKAIEDQIATLSSERRSFDDMKVMIDSIGGILDKGDPVHVRNLIDVLIDHVEIDGDNITIFWDFD